MALELLDEEGVLSRKIEGDWEEIVLGRLLIAGTR